MTLYFTSKTYGNKTVEIDDEDLNKINQFHWGIVKHRNNFYCITRIRINGKRISIKMHRFILNGGAHIDHIDGNGLNNKKDNLRFCTIAQNSHNARKSSRNKSGYKGVCFFKRTKKWRAQIGINNKHIYLGDFDTPEQAYAAYCEASKKYHGKFGRTE